MEVKVKKKPSPIRSPAKKATTTKPKTKAAVKCFAPPNKQPDTPGSPIPGPSSASTPIKEPKEKKIESGGTIREISNGRQIHS